ncbi:MAG: universal stress protein [Bacteroidota bacterium]|nr:universal stress protein [Bacteroidota bacterium]
MSKILIPVDFTATSRNNIQYAMQLAKETGQDIEMLHVIQVDYPSYGQLYPMDPMANPSATDGLAPVNIKKSEENARKAYDKLLKELEFSKPDNIKLDTSIRSGLYPDVINKESARKEITLVLLGGTAHEESNSSLGPDGIQMLFEGAACPVMVLSPQAKFKKINNILYASDLQKEDIDSLKELSAFASHFKSRILALHINDNPDFKERIEEKGFNELVQQKVGYPGIKVVCMSSDKVAKSIANYAHNTEADLIALLKENKGFWKTLFGKSTSEQLMKETEIPLMIFNQENKI